VTTQTPGGGQDRERAQTCSECGTQPSPGQSFCDGCGAVLRWGPSPAAAPAAKAEEPAKSGGAEPVSPPAPPAPRPAAPAPPAPSAPPAPTPAPAPGGGSAAVPPPAGRTAWTPPAQPPTVPAARNAAPPAQPPAAPPAAPGPRPAVGSEAETRPLPSAETTAQTSELASDPATERARALLIPVSDPEGRQDQPESVAPVLPGRPVAARPQVNAPTDHDFEGGVPCPWCHTDNRPDRHFCRRCAMPMAGGPEGPRRKTWWRRLLDWRNRPEPWAGDRPRLRRDFWRIVKWVFIAGVIALVIWGLTNIGTAVQAVEDHFAQRAPVNPDHVSASRSYPGHDASLAFDKFNNTWWGPGVSEDGTGQWIEADFQQPVNLLDLIITPGISAKASDVSASALPHRIDALVTFASGRTTTVPLTLDDGGVQRRSFHERDVSSVRFILQTAYNAGANRQVAIAEIEFFGPAGGGN
jgi:hypothetical protein